MSLMACQENERQKQRVNEAARVNRGLLMRRDDL